MHRRPAGFDPARSLHDPIQGNARPTFAHQLAGEIRTYPCPRYRKYRCDDKGGSYSRAAIFDAAELLDRSAYTDLQPTGGIPLSSIATYSKFFLAFSKSSE